MWLRLSVLITVAGLIPGISQAQAFENAVNPDIELWTEHSDQDFIFYVGGAIDIRFRTNCDAYVVLVAVDGAGQPRIVYPNPVTPMNHVTAGQIVNVSQLTPLRALQPGPLFIRAFVSTDSGFALDCRHNPMPFWWPLEWGAAYLHDQPPFALKHQMIWPPQPKRAVTQGTINHLNDSLNRRMDREFEAFEPVVTACFSALNRSFSRFGRDRFNQEDMLLYVAPADFNPERYFLDTDRVAGVYHHFRYKSHYYHKHYFRPVYHGKLDGYGQWVDRHGCPLWVPSVRVLSWRPFLQGRWAYTSWGWQWHHDAVEPWGMITFRYGYWTLTPEYGWAWVPRRAPVRPRWVECGDYVGWTPPMAPHRVRLGLGFKLGFATRYPPERYSVFTHKSCFHKSGFYGASQHNARYVWKSSDIARRVIRDSGRVRVRATMAVRHDPDRPGAAPQVARKMMRSGTGRSSVLDRAAVFSRQRRTTAAGGGGRGHSEAASRGSRGAGVWAAGTRPVAERGASKPATGSPTIAGFSRTRSSSREIVSSKSSSQRERSAGKAFQPVVSLGSPRHEFRRTRRLVTIRRDGADQGRSEEARRTQPLAGSQGIAGRRDSGSVSGRGYVSRRGTEGASAPSVSRGTKGTASQAYQRSNTYQGRQVASQDGGASSFSPRTGRTSASSYARPSVARETVSRPTVSRTGSKGSRTQSIAPRTQRQSVSRPVSTVPRTSSVRRSSGSSSTTSQRTKLSPSRSSGSRSTGSRSVSRSTGTSRRSSSSSGSSSRSSGASSSSRSSGSRSSSSRSSRSR